jgi:carbon-monoxide dehydrogenase iron sulfur subunit
VTVVGKRHLGRFVGIGEVSMKTVFVRPERCIGCRQCEFACAVEHSHSRDPVLAMFEDPPPQPRIQVEPGPSFNTSFPNKCRHCNPAPCERVCPTAAISRDTALDLVLIDPRKCIACAMCAMACPFDVVTYHAQGNGMPTRIAATKCDGCVNRVRSGKVPACAEACKVDALVFGELNELIREDRMRESRAVLAAATSLEPTAPPAPETVTGWRRWGESATRVAGGAK